MTLLNVPAYWMKHTNFGDALTPYLIEKITGYPAVWTQESNKPKYMVTGSLLNYQDIESCIVWGTGVAFSDTHIKKPLAIHAVRGPLSREIVMKSGHACPEVFGDPALLLPRFYKGNPSGRRFKLGVIPHIVDMGVAQERFDGAPDHQIIDLNSGIENVVDRILECEVLVSSSLHGIIAAHAYGKSCLWVRFSDYVIGDGTKFNDYLQSVGHYTYSPLDLSFSRADVEKIIAEVPCFQALQIDLEKFYKACPFNPK